MTGEIVAGRSPVSSAEAKTVALAYDCENNAVATRCLIRHDTDRYQQGIETLFRRHDECFSYGREHEEKQCDCFRLRLKCDGTRAETRFRLSAKRTSPFKSAGASVQSTTGSRGVRTSGSNAGYAMFRGSVKSTGYQLHSPVSPSLHLTCVIVCHHISTELYN